MPKRIQLRRTKGWRMPPNTVKVARPGVFGNPFRAQDYPGQHPEFLVMSFRAWLELPALSEFSQSLTAKRETILSRLHELRGKDLACFCPLDQPCHSDVLLELANK